MEKERSKKPTFKDMFHWIIRAVGTFLFVFFLMASIIVFTTDMRGTFWLMPYFILPASLICITFGADYWIGNDLVQCWSYCISTIFAVVLLLPYSLWMMSYYGTSSKIGFIATFLLPIIPILQGIRLVRMRKKQERKADKTVKTPQSMRARVILRKVIRVLCLLSICCVLFENWHNAILSVYYHLTTDGITLLPGLITYPLAILSAILLARFMKAEFVQRNSSSDGGAQ